MVDTELCVGSRHRWPAVAGGREPPYRQETFCREMRRETGYLMADEEPNGGVWTHDDENGKFPGEILDAIRDRAP